VIFMYGPRLVAGNGWCVIVPDGGASAQVSTDSSMAHLLIATNTGWVNVGTDHDTAEFAVEFSLRWCRWEAGP
jgi:hypothetical protein